MALWLFTYKETQDFEDIRNAVVRAPNEMRAKEAFIKDQNLTSPSAGTQRIEQFNVERLSPTGDTEVICVDILEA
jgi:hypothetical protein